MSATHSEQTVVFKNAEGTVVVALRVERDQGRGRGRVLVRCPFANDAFPGPEHRADLEGWLSSTAFLAAWHPDTQRAPVVYGGSFRSAHIEWVPLELLDAALSSLEALLLEVADSGR